MQFKIKFASLFAGFLLLLSSEQVLCALPGESIVLDPNTGDYIITYWDYPKSPKRQLRRAIFVPATKIDPAVKSIFNFKTDGEISYAYRVTNSAKSQQSLVEMVLDPVSDIVSPLPLPKNNDEIDPNTVEQINQAGIDALSTPADWFGSAFTSDMGGLRIGWSYAILHNVNDGLIPGNTQGNFGFTSKEIPGILFAQLSGHSPVQGWPDEGPGSDIANEFEEIEQNDYVSRPAAIPTIAIPTPFDAAILLDRIRTEMNSWPAKQLLDPAYAAQLDRYMVAAADAYRLNNTKAGKEHIKTIRKMLAKEHHNLDHDDEGDEDTEEHKTATRFSIDRLAARVLDFDLRYVLKRMESEENGHH